MHRQSICDSRNALLREITAPSPTAARCGLVVTCCARAACHPAALDNNRPGGALLRDLSRLAEQSPVAEADDRD